MAACGGRGGHKEMQKPGRILGRRAWVRACHPCFLQPPCKGLGFWEQNLRNGKWPRNASPEPGFCRYSMISVPPDPKDPFLALPGPPGPEKITKPRNFDFQEQLSKTTLCACVPPYRGGAKARIIPKHVFATNRVAIGRIWTMPTLGFKS